MPRLIEFCELIVDCEHKTAPTQDTGYPSIRTPNIGKGRLILDGVNRVSEETYKAWTQREVPKSGDLILAREAPIGNVAIIPPGLEVCLGQRTVLIRANTKKLNPQYLTYLMLGDEIQGKILSISNGATVHHLNMKDIRELEMPQIPNHSIQDRIANILSAYDDLIENNTRRIKILEEMAQMIYREWFVNFRFPGHESVRMVESELGAIPERWAIRPVSEFGTVVTGKTPSTTHAEFFGGDIPFIKTPDMHGNMFCIEVADHLSFAGAESQKNKTIPANSLIVNCIGALAGSVSITTTPAQTNQQINSVVLNQQSTREFLYFSLTRLRETLRSIGSNGATMINVNKSKFENLKITTPPADVLQRFHSIAFPQFELIRNFQARVLILCITRDLLLPKLISGEIPVGAADEAAAELAEQTV
jgi:type I restriction enzyme, S subunit